MSRAFLYLLGAFLLAGGASAEASSCRGDACEAKSDGPSDSRALLQMASLYDETNNVKLDVDEELREGLDEELDEEEEHFELDEELDEDHYEEDPFDAELVFAEMNQTEEDTRGSKTMLLEHMHSLDSPPDVIEINGVPNGEGQRYINGLKKGHECFSKWLAIGKNKKQPFRICYDSAWTDKTEKRPAVIVFDWGKKKLLGADRFLDLGYVAVFVRPTSYVSCNSNMVTTVKWLAGATSNVQTWNGSWNQKSWTVTKFLADMNAKFRIKRSIFMIGYSRTAMCVAGTAMQSQSPALKGVITLGTMNFIAGGAHKADWLSYSCVPADKIKDANEYARLGGKTENGQRKPTAHFTDLEAQCSHTAYAAGFGAANIIDKTKKFINNGK